MSLLAGAVHVKLDGDALGLSKATNTGEDALNKLESGASKTQKAWDSLGNTMQFALGNLIAGGIQSGVSAIGEFFTNSIDNAKALEKSLTTLEVIAPRFNVNAEQAKIAAKELGKELKIGPGASAEALQNLLKSGLNLDQASDLMRRMTNEAITGKSENISLADAVQNLSFAYATNNSALGNMSGISENFEDITKKGKEALIAKGVAVEDITDEMAKYEGIINLTNLTAGSAEKFNNTLIDSEINKKIAYDELSTTIGQKLSPALMIYNNVQTAVFETLNSNSAVVAGLTASVLALAIGFAWFLAPSLWATAAAAWAAVAPFLPIVGIALLVGAAVTGLAYLWNSNFLGIKDAVMQVWNTLMSFLQPALDELKKAWDNLYSALKPVWDMLMAALMPALTQLWNFLKPVLIPVLGVVAAIIFGPLLLAFGAIIGIIYGVSYAFNWVANIIRNNMGNIQNAINMGKAAFDSWMNKANQIRSGIVSAFNGIQSGISNAIKGAVNSMISNLNRAVSGVNNITRNLPDVPGVGKIPQIPTIPQFKRGVTNFEGGLAEVHKDELLVNLPKDTDVITAAETKRKKKGEPDDGNSDDQDGKDDKPEVHFHFEDVVFATDQNIRDFARRAKRILLEEGI